MRLCRPINRFSLLLVAATAVPLVLQPVAADNAAHSPVITKAQPPAPRPELKTPKAKSWPFVPWSYAKAYTYNFAPEVANILQVVNPDGTWNSRLRSEQLITDAQAEAAARLVAQSIGTFETTKCTVPRHAIVLFDRDDKPVAAASVCFDCEGILVWPDYERPEDFYYEEGKYEAVESKFMAALESWKTLFGDELGLPVDYRQAQ